MNENLAATKNELIPAVITYFRKAMDSDNLNEADYISTATEFVDRIFEFVAAQRQTQPTAPLKVQKKISSFTRSAEVPGWAIFAGWFDENKSVPFSFFGPLQRRPGGIIGWPSSLTVDFRD